MWLKMNESDFTWVYVFFTKGMWLNVSECGLTNMSECDLAWVYVTYHESECDFTCHWVNVA